MTSGQNPQSETPPMVVTVFPTDMDTNQAAVTQQVEEPPVYVIRWEDNEYSRKALNSPSELRTELESGGLASHDGPSALGRVERLVVIHGMPVDYLAVLKSNVDIDPAFVEAHLGRRAYRRRRRNVYPSRSLRLVYPELLKKHVDPSGAPDGIYYDEVRATDVFDDPPVFSISRRSDAVAFCSASLWACPDGTSVLFLDRPIWRHPGCQYRKARHQWAMVTPDHGEKSAHGDKKQGWDVVFTTGDEQVSLEDYLVDRCADRPAVAGAASAVTSFSDYLLSEIGDLAFEHWTEFLGNMSIKMTPYTPENRALQWQILQSLEQSLDSNKALTLQDSHLQLRCPDWEGLSERVERRVRLWSDLKPEITVQTTDQFGKPINDADDDDEETQAIDQPAPSNSDNSDTQRSLNRVTYMGGILLPMSIISSILSMSDPFSPGDDLFWVFWVASVPVVIITILFIYADSIRDIEVWVQEQAAGDEAGSTTVADGSEPAGEEKPGSGVGRPTTPQLESAIPTLRTALPVDEDGNPVYASMRTDGYEPAAIVHKRMGKPKRPAWKKEPLGWVGACKSILQIYDLKKGRQMPPGMRPPGMGGPVRMAPSPPKRANTS